MMLPFKSSFQHGLVRNNKLISRPTFSHHHPYSYFTLSNRPASLLLSPFALHMTTYSRSSFSMQKGRLLQDNVAGTVKPKDRRKHKVALVAGFIGSKYYGLQMDPTCTEGSRFLPTIENELRLALLKGQYIKQENSLDLSKIHWSRSSRTDKGVHANRVVFCGHLEMPIVDEEAAPNSKVMKNNKGKYTGRNSSSAPLLQHAVGSTPSSSLHSLADSDMVTDPVRYPTVVSTLNKFLPEDIKVFAVTKVNNGFSAKDTCQWRGYDYYMPIEMLSNQDNAGQGSITSLHHAQMLIDKFNGFLNQMEGCHGFHNFHRLSEKELKKIGLKQKRMKKYIERSTRTPFRDHVASKSHETSENDRVQKPSGFHDDDDAAIDEGETGMPADDCDLEEREDTQMVLETTPASISTSTFSQRFFSDDWVESPRETHTKTKCTIYRCHATLLKIPNSDRFMVKVNIIGHYFLLHQIRLMLGAAILCTTNVLPPFFIRLATVAPVAFRLPLVPAEGLVLSSAGFHNNKHGPDIALSSATAAGQNKIVLMTADDYKQSDTFLIEKILPRVVEDWSRDNNTLLQQWSSYCSERFLPSDRTLKVWQELLVKYEEHHQLYENKRNERERNRISFQVKLFYKDMQKREEQMSKIKESIRILVTEIEQAKLASGNDDIDNKEVNNKKYRLATLKSKLRQLTDPSDGKVLLLRCEYPHRLYLPNTVATLICVKFQLAPCPLVSEALRALATKNILALKDNLDAIEIDPLTDYANPNYYISLIDDEVNRLIKKRKDLSKDLQNPKSWNGYEKLRLWTNSQHKHLFIG